MKEETKCYCGHTTYCDCGLETIEEAMEKYPLINQRIGFKLGVKWQQERMFELMDEYQNWLFNSNDEILTFREWFEQFKKK